MSVASTFENNANGSIGIGNLNKQSLVTLKIPLPKSPTFQTPLQPYWDELDTLRQQVKTHEAEYQQALTDLRCASIDDDASDAAAA